MELSKTFSISTDYKDRKTNPDWEKHTSAEVVFIDKSQPGAAPTLYLLKDNKLSIQGSEFYKSTSFSFSHDTFFAVGEVAAIDRRNKRVLLSNRDSIAYNYLVIASGSKPVFSVHETEFAAGLQALMDALRVKPKIPNSFAAYLNPKNPAAIESSRSTAAQDLAANTPHMDDIAYPSIASANKGRDFELSSINKRLYEVQL